MTRTSYVVMLRVDIDEDISDDPKLWSWDLILADDQVQVREVSSLRIGDVR